MLYEKCNLLVKVLQNNEGGLSWTPSMKLYDLCASFARLKNVGSNSVLMRHTVQDNRGNVLV